MTGTILTLNALLVAVIVQAQTLLIEEPIRFLALGDSYTIGQSVTYEKRWPTQLFDSLAALDYEVDTVNFIAKTGWRTDNLKSWIDNIRPDSNYNLVSLLIGVNNQYQGEPISRYLTDFPELLQLAIDFAGGKKERVFVVTIPDYMYTPTRNFFPNPDAVSRKIDEYNAIAEAYCDTFEVKYFNITSISRQGLDDTELVADDGLHPSGKQYSAWVDLMLSNGIVTSNQFSIDEDKSVFFPNPVRDTLLLGEDIDSWKIYSQTGRLILAGNEKTIDVKKITSGMYIFRGYGNDNREVISEKLLIKKQGLN